VSVRDGERLLTLELWLTNQAGDVAIEGSAEFAQADLPG
jgi:hypothetical protein